MKFHPRILSGLLPSLTGTDLKNRVHPLATAVALSRLTTSATDHQEIEARNELIESLRSVDFLHGPKYFTYCSIWLPMVPLVGSSRQLQPELPLAYT